MQRKTKSSSKTIKKGSSSRRVRARSTKGATMSASSFNLLEKGLYMSQGVMLVWLVAMFFFESARSVPMVPFVFLVSTLPMSIGFYLARKYGGGRVDNSASTWMQISNYNNINNINKNLNDINKKF